MTGSLLRALRVGLALGLVLAVPALAASCQSIAGIEDRELGPCSHFCDVVQANCKNANAVYENRAKCMGVCELYDVGDSTEWQKQNTLTCRLHHATEAGNKAEEDRSDLCRSAGPEGIDCGGACQSYCQLYQRACGQVQCGSYQTCVDKCAALRNEKTFNLTDDYEGNTLQCRFVHLSNATIAKDPHCGHAQLQTPTDHCNDLPESGSGSAGASSTEPDRIDKPLCSEYCRVNGVACQGKDAMYESEDQCKALCPYFPQGEIADKDQNTLGCRLYHSYNALCGAAAHCPHSGPGGEGHCGTTPADKCLAYCHLARGVCPAEYASTDGFGDDDDACAADCAELPDAIATDDPAAGTRYSLSYAETPGTLACRFLALSRAAEDLTLCGTLAAFGQSECAE